MNIILKYGLLSCLIISISCSKDNLNDDGNGNACLSAKVDGVNKIFNVITILSENDKVITIHGYNRDDKIGITLTVENATGLYTHGDATLSGKFTFGNSFDFFDQDNDGPAIDYGIISGRVEITALSSLEITGSFQFIGESYDGNQINVSEGRFTCKKN